MKSLLLTTLIGLIIGAAAVFLLAGGIPEGAIAGAVLGGSLGMIVGLRRNAGSSGVSFEYEAAGIADDNLITIARNNLGRDAYRSSYDLLEQDDPVHRGEHGEAGR